MLGLLALAIVSAEPGPDMVEQSLARQCGVAVPRSARMIYAGDNWTLIVDSSLPDAKIQCARQWAATWPTANAIGLYASRRYPTGPYDVPLELRRASGGGSPAAGAAGLAEADQLGGAQGRQPLPLDGRAAFRQAVDAYQIFVVPHCAPNEVRAYVAAMADRDRAFVRSLRGTYLATDYKRAVAGRAERDGRTVYECAGPPPPPPPPPGTTLPPPTSPQAEAEHPDPLAGRFAAGNRQFAIMVRLRDILIGSPPGKRPR